MLLAKPRTLCHTFVFPDRKNFPSFLLEPHYLAHCSSVCLDTATCTSFGLLLPSICTLLFCTVYICILKSEAVFHRNSGKFLQTTQSQIPQDIILTNWGRSQWSRDLRRGSTAAHLLRLRFRIPPRAGMLVSCECCVLSGRVLRRADHSSRGVLPRVACVSVTVVSKEALAY